MKSRGVERSSWAGGYYKVMASAISISLLLSSLFMSSDFNTVLAKDDPVSPQSVITYTYAGVTQDGAHDAYFCDVDIMPPVGLNLNSMTEFSDTQYALVTTSDNLRAASFDPGLGDEIFVWSDIHINESPDTITEIVMTFEGQVMFGMEFQLWVYNRQIWTWEQLGLGVPLAPNTDVTIMRTISASLSDYVQDGVLSWGCYNTFNGDITSVDRMEVQITTTGGFQLDVISPDGGENWMGGSNQKIEWFSTDVDKYFINNETLVGPTSGGETGPYFTANVPVVFHVLFLFETGIGWYGMVEGIDYTFDNALGMVDLSLWGPMGANQYLHIFYDYTISTSISIDIYYTMNNGVNWTLITSGETNDGEYDWLVPMDTSDQCLVRIEATDGYTNELIDVSEDLFTIDSTSPFVKVNIPDGGETFGAGSLENITWTVWDNYIAPPNMIDIYYSTNNGTDWILISAGEFNDGHFSWNVPYIASDECLIRVNGSDMAGNPNSDVSNSVFTITITLPLVHVITPNSGEIWMGGSQQIIEWSASSETGLMPDPISIYYSINNGINWTVVATNESNDGQYLWTLPFATSDECLVMVIAYDTFGGNSSDLSNMTFTIDSTLPFVKVNLPNGGEVFKGGTQTNITWTMWDNYASPPSTIYIYYSLNNGADWTLISANEFNDGHYLWDMLFVTSQECLIRINGTDTVGNPNSDVSDNVFTIDSILPIVTVQSPNGGEALQGGSTFFINWTSSDNYGLAANNVSIYYSINGGLGWDVVATGEADDGSYLWTVPFEDSQDCMVKVLVRDMAGNENEDVSDGFFTIDSTPPTVWVISPDGGELWSGNDIHQIQWNAYDNFNLSANPVSLYYSLDNGGNWTLIAENEANDGSYDWLTPLSNSTECLIMITVVDEVGNNASDTSNGTFTFNSSPPEVIVFSPDGGEILNGGGQHLIEWSAFDDIGLAPNPISIYYSINNGVNWTVIAANEPNDGQYLWSIPYETSDACRVKVVATDISGGDGWDMSNDTFTIDSTLPFVKVNLPNGGEVFKGGTQTNITWTMWDNFGAPMNTIDIYYSLNNGADWTLISANELNDGHYLWDIPFANSEDCLVRINGTDTAGNVNTDQSDGVFTIDSTAPNVLVIYPNGNELLRGNDVYVIQWSASDNFGLAATPITMYYSLNNGAIWTLIAGNEANDGSYDWLTPFSNSTQCLIQIVAVDEVGYTTSDESNFTFTIDSNDPASVVDSISSYWHNTAPLTLTATVSDNIGISYVELWYRFSVDNISWGGWANQSLDAASPWSWSFDWPTGEGYYEFYSRARDLSGNYEAAPVSADTSAGYDITSPVSNFIQEGPYWHNDLLILLNTTTFDSFSGVNFVEVWIRHSLNNLTWGAWNHTFDVLGPTWNNIPYWWAEGPGYYEFYTRAIDNAGNYESAPATADVKHAYDPDGPITSALTIEPNPTIIDIDNTAWLNATIGNITFGSNIVQAEWYLQNGSAPGIPDGSANPMNPADGLWDAPMENITAMLDISGWTDLGTYELWVHGLDEAGNWGPWVNVILIRQSGVTQLAIIPPSVTMTAGSQISFTVQTQNETGFPANVAEDTIIFLTTSSAAGELREMGTANIIGQVTILAGTNSAIFDYYDTDAMNGPYTLTANSTGLSNGTAQVTVNPAVIDSIVVDPDPTTVVVGENRQFAAIAYDIYGNIIPDVQFDWSTDVGLVNSTGYFTAQTTPILGFVNATNGTVTGSAIVDVIPGPLDHIIVTPDPVAMTTDDTQQFVAVGYDSYNNVVAISPTWEITGGGTVNATGFFDATTPGIWTIYANESGISDSATITITHGAAATLILAPATATITSDEYVIYTATAYDDDGNGWDVTNATIFTDNDPLGYMDDNTYHAGQTGTWTINGTYGAAEGFASATVNPGTAAFIMITCPSITDAGEVFNVTVTVYDAEGNVKTDYVGTIHLSSSDLYPATLPPDHVFTLGDAGSYTFEGLVLYTRGVQDIVALDTIIPALTNTSQITVHAPDIQITKVSVSHADPGDEITYTIYYNNSGEISAAWLWLNDTLPADVDFVSASDGGVNVGGIVQWSFIDVPPGSRSVTLTVRVKAGLADGTIIENNVNCNYTADNGFRLAEEFAWFNLTVAAPDITVEKVGYLDTMTVNDEIIYTIYYNNTGTGTAGFVWINDSLPSGVTFMGDTASNQPDWAWEDVSSTPLLYRFENVTTGQHSFEIRTMVGVYVENGTYLTNWAFLNYTDANGNLLASSNDSSTVLYTYAVANTSLTFPPGTLVVPMDDKQPQQLPAYGLSYWMSVYGQEVHWAIRQGKKYQEWDFNATTDDDGNPSSTGTVAPRSYGGGTFLLKDPDMSTPQNEAWDTYQLIQSDLTALGHGEIYDGITIHELAETIILRAKDTCSIIKPIRIAVQDSTKTDCAYLWDTGPGNAGIDVTFLTDGDVRAGALMTQSEIECSRRPLYDWYFIGECSPSADYTSSTAYPPEDTFIPEIMLFANKTGHVHFEGRSATINTRTTWFTESTPTISEGTVGTGNNFIINDEWTDHPYAQTYGALSLEGSGFKAWEHDNDWNENFHYLGMSNESDPGGTAVFYDYPDISTGYADSSPYTYEYDYVYTFTNAGGGIITSTSGKTNQIPGRRLLMGSAMTSCIIPTFDHETSPENIPAGVESEVTVYGTVEGGTVLYWANITDYLSPNATLDLDSIDIKPRGGYLYDALNNTLTFNLAYIDPRLYDDGVIFSYNVIYNASEEMTDTLLTSTQSYRDNWGKYNVLAKNCISTTLVGIMNLTKSANKEVIPVGQDTTVRLTIKVENYHPTKSLTNITIEDIIENGTWAANVSTSAGTWTWDATTLYWNISELGPQAVAEISFDVTFNPLVEDTYRLNSGANGTGLLSGIQENATSNAVTVEASTGPILDYTLWPAKTTSETQECLLNITNIGAAGEFYDIFGDVIDIDVPILWGSPTDITYPAGWDYRWLEGTRTLRFIYDTGAHFSWPSGLTLNFGFNITTPSRTGIYDFAITGSIHSTGGDPYIYEDTLQIEVVKDLYTQELVIGWNFISIPIILENTTIISVLSSIDGKWDYALYYDSSDLSDHWKTYHISRPAILNDLWNIDHTMGFWLNVTEAATLEINGGPTNSATITLNAGWNMVGYPAVNDTAYTVADLKADTGATIVQGFNASQPYNIEILPDSYVLKRGEGYWIKVDSATTWTVDW